MTTLAPDLDTAAPPDGYPERDWADDGLYYVAPELHPWYIAAAETGTGSFDEWRDPNFAKPRLSIPDARGDLVDTPATYEPWAHIVRRDRARVLHRSHLDHLATEARRRPCVVCGARLLPYEMRQVKGAAEGMTACPADAELLERELSARAVILDGITRQQAVQAAADRLLGGTD